jgi:hypothetical protein
MQFLAIILFCVGAAVVYGILHDQVTARVCVEYFTIGHPPIFPTEDPTLLGIGWGILATWWVGALLGVPLAVVARAGSRPPRTAASLILPVVLLLVVTGCCALVGGLVGWVLASNGVVFLLEPLASLVPREKHVAFLADLWAHLASYVAGFVGGIVLMVLVWRARGRAARQHSVNPTAGRS